MSALNSSSDYAGALAAMRPTGRVWPQDPSSAQQTVLAAIAPSAERLDADAQALLIDAFPATAVNLLTEWEEALGLSATDASDSVAVRQANVVAKFTEVGGQSQDDFIAYAAALGFTIQIQTYAPSRCGIAGCGDELGGPAWCFAWSITVSANTGAMTNAQLLAALQAIAPAETTVFLSA